MFTIELTKLVKKKHLLPIYNLLKSKVIYLAIITLLASYSLVRNFNSKKTINRLKNKYDMQSQFISHKDSIITWFRLKDSNFGNPDNILYQSIDEYASRKNLPIEKAKSQYLMELSAEERIKDLEIIQDVNKMIKEKINE